MEKKWYGKIIYDNEGVIDYLETHSQEIAEAYAMGFNRAKEEIETGDGDNPLEDYYVVVDQLEPLDDTDPRFKEMLAQARGENMKEFTEVKQDETV